MSGTDTGGAIGDATGSGAGGNGETQGDVGDPNNPQPGSQQANNNGGGTNGSGGAG